MFNNGLKKAIVAAGMVGAMMTPLTAMAANSPATAETIDDLVEEGKVTNVQTEDGKVVSFDVVEGSGIEDGFQYFNLGDEEPTKVYIRNGKFTQEITDTANFVERMYETGLDREGDAEGVDHWVGQMSEGEWKAADIANFFLRSAEYVAQSKTNEQIVDDFYQAMFGREADAEGKEHWVGCLNVGMSVEALVAGFSRSTEFVDMCAKLNVEAGVYASQNARDAEYEITSFAQDMYTNGLGRVADPEGLDYWCARLISGSTGAQVATEIIFSKEGESALASDEAFVNMLYAAFFGREADAEGFAFWTAALNDGADRREIFNGFVVSAEFAKRCEKAGIVVGDPIPVAPAGDNTIE